MQALPAFSVGNVKGVVVVRVVWVEVVDRLGARGLVDETTAGRDEATRGERTHQL